MTQLANKVALVTGGSRGIGAAIAKRLAADGAKVAITFSSSPDRAEEVVQSIQAAGGAAFAIHADSADAAKAGQAVEKTVEHFGGLDILVNNAGVAHLAPIAEFPDDEFERLLSINVRAVFYTTRAAVPRLPDGGRIIHVGSVNSDFVPYGGASVYALTKGAVASFTRGLARDLGARGITVNNVQPGPIDTDMNPAHGRFAERAVAMVPLLHYGQVSDVAGLVAFLAGPEGAYITGASLKIDGGFTA